MAAISDYLENKIIDWLFRGQAYAPPAGLHVALFTASPADPGGGTEVTGGAYARVNLAPSLTNWAGTQAAGSTVASSGTGATTSNNAAITFPAPTATWGSIVAFGVFDASTGGNLLVWGALSTAKTVNNGDAAPSFQAGALSFTLDN